MLSFAERGHAAVFKDATGTCVIGGKCIDDVAVKGVKLGCEITRAAMHLQIGAVIVCGIDPEIAGSAWHDLGETKRPNWRARSNREATFLPDQRL